MTPAGTISPARVMVCGVGVAGLQAIATAKRLGARVEATDVRAETEEQVQSLGAKFVKVDLGETGATKDGYAKALTPEQLQKQKEELAKLYPNYDIIITTAKLFGRKAPVLIEASTVANMKPGTIVVDMAADSGGNVEGSVANEEVNVNGVTLIGYDNLPGRVPHAASQMYSSNLVNMVDEFWDTAEGGSNTFQLNREDDIIQGCLVTHDGAVVNDFVLSIWNK
ncbi:MAG: Rossmann-fold NAD(P)-binding domain-containing protein, partial [Planctomycetota bacterium]|jgi:NAD(P) transhydrogenase subunit alpha